jgi:sulfite exporter TauE/SafE
MTDTLTIGAALLLGLLASGHCLVMCGGISGALGLVTAKRLDGTSRRVLLVTYQLGRIASYTVAGFGVGLLGDRLISIVNVEAVRAGLRVATGVALAVAALAMLGRVKAPGMRLGRWLWPHIAHAGRRLLPVSNVPRAFAFGMLWGWMPCGLAYNLLLIAMLGARPVQSAATMFAFGLGTLPAMLAAAWGAPAVAAWASRRSVRNGAAAGLFACAVLVMSAPWLPVHAPWMHAWLPFDCTAPAH